MQNSIKSRDDMRDKERRELIKIKGANSTEKFSCLEKILKRMAKRMGQKIVGIMPPSVIFHQIKQPDEIGVILRCFLPTGEITKICLAILKYNTEKPIRFTCNLQTVDGRGRQFSFETHEKIFVEEINLPIEDVSFFTLKIDQSEIENSELELPLIEDIWITALFQFDKTESQIKLFMVEELEKLEEMETDEGI